MKDSGRTSLGDKELRRVFSLVWKLSDRSLIDGREFFKVFSKVSSLRTSCVVRLLSWTDIL